jgi:KUP system potassium uptake protein
VRFQEVPWVPEQERLKVEPLVDGFWRVQVNYGFKDEPDVPRALRLCTNEGLKVDEAAISYFLSREIVIPTRGAGMVHWREALFATMSRNAGSVGDFFRLPHNLVVELGTRVQI